MAYRLSRKAEADVIRIYVTGVRDFGVSHAEHYHAGLERAFAFLSEFPRAARERIELARRSRAYPYRSHLIFYRISGPDIFIQRVRHGREDWINDIEQQD